MAVYNYQSIKDVVSKSGGLTPPGAAPEIPLESPLPGIIGATGTTTIDLGAFQDEVAALKFSEESDQTFDLNVNFEANDVVNEIQIDEEGKNIYSNKNGAGSLFLNSTRVMINASQDYAMIFGEQGVALASPNRVNIDAGKTITLFGQESLFLGLPNKGKGSPDSLKDKLDKGKRSSVGSATNDELYEPMVLGAKLVNFLEDLIVTIENGTVATALSNGVWQPTTLAEFELLKVRLPELVSTYAYVDGLSHETVDESLLSQIEAAKKAAKDYVPPRQITGITTITEAGPGAPGGAIPAPAPLTSPYAELPGYFETPSNDPFGDSNSL